MRGVVVGIARVLTIGHMAAARSKTPAAQAVRLVPLSKHSDASEELLRKWLFSNRDTGRHHEVAHVLAYTPDDGLVLVHRVLALVPGAPAHGCRHVVPTHRYRHTGTDTQVPKDRDRRTDTDR